MKIRSKCDMCIGKHICSIKTNGIYVDGFDNIIMIIDCENFASHAPYIVNSVIKENLIFRDELEHCDICQFKSKCKFYSDKENMMKEINDCKALISKEHKIVITCKNFYPDPSIVLKSAIDEAIQNREKDNYNTDTCNNACNNAENTQNTQKLNSDKMPPIKEKRSIFKSLFKKFKN